jgi:hypothetical protein
MRWSAIIVAGMTLAAPAAADEWISSASCDGARTEGRRAGELDRTSGRRPRIFVGDSADTCELVRREAYRMGWEWAPPWMSPRARRGRSLVITGAILSIVGTAFIVPGAIVMGQDQGCRGPCEGGAYASVWVYAGIPQALVGAILIAIGAGLWGTAPSFQR